MRCRLTRIRMVSVKNKQKPEKQKITSVGQDVEKLEPLCTVGGDVKWYSRCEKQYGGSAKN